MTETSAPDPTWKPIAASSIQNEPPTPVEWDIESLLQADDGPACWVGDSGCGKSYLALHASHCLATGAPVFGKYAAKKHDKVFYVNLDAGRNSFNRRVLGLPTLPPNLYFVHGAWNEEEFARLISDNRGAFFVIDCHTDTYALPPGADMANHMRKAVKFFRDRFEEYGANGLIIDHTKRVQGNSWQQRGADLMYGSTQKKATFRQVTLIEDKTPPNMTPGHARVQFSCLKMSESETFESFFVDLTFGDHGWACEYAGEVTAQSKRLKKGEALLEGIVGLLKSVMPDNLSANEIAGALKVNRTNSNFSNALKAAVESGRVRSIGGGRSTKYAYVGEGNQDSLDVDLPDPITMEGLQ